MMKDYETITDAWGKPALVPRVRRRVQQGDPRKYANVPRMVLESDAPPVLPEEPVATKVATATPKKAKPIGRPKRRNTKMVEIAQCTTCGKRFGLTVADGAEHVKADDVISYPCEVHRG